MVYAVQSWVEITVTDITQTVYTPTLEFLILDHLHLYQRSSSPGDEETEIVDFTVTGPSGSPVFTLGGSVVPVNGDVFRFTRESPFTAATFSVDFNDAATLTEADLDTAMQHLIFLFQEAKDSGLLALQRANNDAWDAESIRIKNLGEPQTSSDAARLQEVLDVSVAAGNLPTVTSALNEYILQVKAPGAWKVTDPTTALAGLGVLTAALRAIGVSSATEVPDRGLADARYAQLANDLSDLADAATARTNLGLGTSAVVDAGTGASEMVQLDGSAALPAVDGSNLTGITADGRIEAVFIHGMTQAQTLDDTAWRIITFAGAAQTILNGGSEISEAADVFTLKQGTYRVRLSVMVESADPSALRTMLWRLRQTSGTGSPQDALATPSISVAPNAANGPATFETEIALVVSDATQTFEVQAWDTAGATEKLSVRMGQIAFEKVGV